MTHRKPIRRLFSTAAAMLLLAGSVTAAADPPAPAENKPALSEDWPAFHGGGELRGEAAALPAKPLANRWTFKPDEPGPIENSASIVGDAAYVGDVKGRLYSLALDTGKQNWVYTVQAGFGAPPLVANGRVYIGDMEGIFHCVDAATGKQVWTYDADSGQPIHAGANLAGDRLIFGDDAANVICLTTDGKLAWKVTTGDRVNGTPAIGANGLAYVSGCDAKLRGIEIATGKERFALDLGSLAPGSPAIVGDKLVIGLDGGKVVCVAADGSKILWTYDGIRDGAMVYGSPAVSNGVAIVGARDRQVHAIDIQTGQRKWVFPTRGDVDSAPAISGDRVYVGSRDKKVYALDLATGKPLSDFQANRGVEAAPAIGRGVIVIGDTSGAVHCLEPKE